MKKNEFFDQYKDPRWQKKRLQIMERDEFMCQNCFDSESTLNVHHKYYIHGKSPWEYSNELLITLCEGCHEWEEDKKYIILDFTKVLLSEGYSASELVQLLELLRQLPSGDYGLSYIHAAIKEYKDDIQNSPL
jgi:hypothetical protein